MTCGCCRVELTKRGRQPQECLAIEVIGLGKKDPVYLCPVCDKHTLDDIKANSQPEGA